LARQEPALTIVVASYNARDSIGRCLTSLVGQTLAEPFEVVVVDSSTDGTGELVTRDFPQARLVRSAQRLFAGDARNRGIAASSAPVIAFMDADCTVDPGWAANLLAVHRAGHRVVASAIDNGARDSLLSWTYYLCEFSHWLPGGPARPISEAAGCCLSLDRSVFERHGPFLTGTYSSDTAFHWKLQAVGQSAHFVPDIRVHHHASGSLVAMLRHVCDHRRCFARVKCRAKHLTPAERLLALLLEPATPGLLMAAVLLRLRRHPVYLPVFAAVSPALFLAFVARAVGETVGYLRGA